MLLIASDYQVLRDSEITLGEGAKRRAQFQWFVPEHFLFGTERRDAAVLSFNIRTPDFAKLTVKAIGNGPTTILNGTGFAEGFTRTYQEAFDLAGIVSETGDVIGTPIGSLLIEFSVEDGPAVLSDIVIHSKIAFDA